MVIDYDFRVEVIGHETLRVQAGGRTLVRDPWLVDPLGEPHFASDVSVHRVRYAKEFYTMLRSETLGLEA